MSTLLQTKLAIPTIRTNLVVRDRLWQRLAAVRSHKLVLISAPAGFGKTTLLASYAARAAIGEETTLAWLSLGEEDNDPVRFTAYFLAALSAAGLELSIEDTAVYAAAPDSFMTEVVNSLTAILAPHPTAHLILVLDDYHLIHNHLIHGAITFLLENMPPQMHLVLATRADPPLPLARWRAKSQLAELRLNDLRFTESETADFLRLVLGGDLSAADVTILNERTEGWVAGLQLAAVSLQGRSDATDFVQSFGGSNRYILDYLMEEVLARQPEEVTHFLLQTAVLERFCAPLCDAVLGREAPSLEQDKTPAAAPSSQQILERLEAANLFLLPLDDERRWYRYHRLFSDLLRQRLQQTQPTQLPLLHQRAAGWFETNGFPEEAIAHALLAGAHGQAARMIEQLAENMLMRSEQVTFMRWLEALPETELVQRPSLSLYYAWTLSMEGRAHSEVERALRHVAADGAPGELALVQSILALLNGQGPTAVALTQQALAQLAPDRVFLHGVATWILGTSLLFLGKLEEGIQILEEAVQLSRQAGNMTIAAASLGRLANQAWRAGDLHRAKRFYEQALVLATDEAERPLPVAGESHIGLTRIFFEWNQLQTAQEHLETGLVLAERWREISLMAGEIWHARLRQAQGDAKGANEALARAQLLAIHTEGTQFDDMAVAMTEAYLRWLQGDLKAVEAWCTERKIPQEIDMTALSQREDIIEGHLRKYEFIMLARLRLAQQRPDEVLTLLQPLLADVQRLQRRDLQIEIHVLTALAHQLKGSLAAADHHLREALQMAERGGFVRLFIEAGQDVAKLLKRLKPGDSRQQAYVQTLLAAFGQVLPAAPTASVPRQPELIEPLSERELEILTLVANGLSNREIAAELVLSLPTIKWHTSNIYGKLGVGNRTAAVGRARELRILD